MRRRHIETAFEEAVTDAMRWKRQADRLLAVLKRTERELGEEIFKLQSDVAFLEKVNADLAFSLAARDHELSMLKKEDD